MLIDHWPFVGLGLTTDRLELRVPTDAELTEVAVVSSGGVHEPDERPYLTPWTDLPPPERILHVMKQHWNRRGDWSSDAWALELAVFHEQRPIGMVALRGRDFPVLREVKTESWLGLEHHGKGLGTEARAALLHLAFDGLGAGAAISEVFQDNLASQGVSRKLGYQHDGISRDVLDGRAVTSDRLRLTREMWEEKKHLSVTMTGLSPCLPFFGIMPGQRD
ncbi:N-acetyltransferase [Cryobacterium sandaracinum]|uniref:N-acetyltransferase n=1 Tax=Cryobacterium sandaracinum TaxID=1259247 RepID=A0ABY2JFU2_9MICO|nr:GNAT family protein [Cryobacterium sandaracinum]TFD04830.1 N-acetyltransferase [Cryobacterium sandaracinum]